jgi:hypothetical protein
MLYRLSIIGKCLHGGVTVSRFWVSVLFLVFGGEMARRKSSLSMVYAGDFSPHTSGKILPCPFSGLIVGTAVSEKSPFEI